MFYFFDTSALIKLYHVEDGTNVVKQLFEDKNADVCIARIAFTEFYSALYKKARTKEITDPRVILQSINDFEIDMQDVWVVQMHDKLFSEAQNLLKRYGLNHSLRTLDALQLACAELVAQTEELSFVTADYNLYDIAKELGFNLVFASDKN
jgi:predicted nucleic acid-binding protein